MLLFVAKVIRQAPRPITCQKFSNLCHSVSGGPLAGRCRIMSSDLWSFLHFECFPVATMFMEKVSDKDYDNDNGNEEKEGYWEITDVVLNAHKRTPTTENKVKTKNIYYK